MASTLAACPVANARWQSDTILLVEDDLDIAGMYRLKLQHDGYRVHAAMTGEMALALAFQSCADLVLLDMGLPAMDGLQVLAALRADPRTFSLPVVILSNYDDPDLIERGLQLGAIDYLIKSQTTPAGVSGGIARWMAGPNAPCRPELLRQRVERGERFDVYRGVQVQAAVGGRGRRVT